MIMLYTTHCPQCEALKRKLDTNGIKYEICDDVEIMTTMGLRTVPVLECDGEIKGFKDAMQWLMKGCSDDDRRI